MKITVNDQHIIIDRTEIVGNSSKLYDVHFDFDSSWEGFNKIAVFQLGYNKPVTMALVNNECVIPWEVLPQKGGILKIGVYGTKGDIEKPTIWCHEIQVKPGTPDDGIAGKEPTQEVFDQIMQMIEDGRLRGEDGIGIAEITLESEEPEANAYRITYTDPEKEPFVFIIKNGEKGEKGDPGKIRFLIVNELPTEDIDESAIYLMPKDATSETDVYTEWIYTNGAWEELGGAKVSVDLSGYVKQTDLANADAAGIVKSGNGLEFTDGFPASKIYSKELFQASADGILVGKGTLMNVIGSLVADNIPEEYAKHEDVEAVKEAAEEAITQLAYAIPTDEHINSLIDLKLQEVEYAYY